MASTNADPLTYSAIAVVSRLCEKVSVYKVMAKRLLADIMISNRVSCFYSGLIVFLKSTQESCRRPSVTNLSHKFTGHVNFDQNNIAMLF